MRDRQIGTPCRVRLDIYLVGYGSMEGKAEKREEEGEGGGKERELRLEDEDQPVSAERGGSGHGLSLKERTDHYSTVFLGFENSFSLELSPGHLL